MIRTMREYARFLEDSMSVKRAIVSVRNMPDVIVVKFPRGMEWRSLIQEHLENEKSFAVKIIFKDFTLWEELTCWSVKTVV